MAEGTDLKKCIQECINNTQLFLDLKNKIYDKKVTILLGQTKCGKSTLANYLLGNDLISVKDDFDYSYELISNTTKGPVIHNGAVSGTSISTVHTTPDGDILIDSPGFEDNRGIQQDIFNCLCIHQIRFAKSIKFVFVCYIGDLLNHNVQNFTKLLKQMADLVPNIDKINKSWCIIFTKDEHDITPNTLRTKIEHGILHENAFKADKKLLPALIGNKKSIGIFKAPKEEGAVILKKLDLNVKDAINACDYSPVGKLTIKFALGQESINYLKYIYRYYENPLYFKSEIKRTIEEYINYFEIDKYVYAAYGTELIELQILLGLLSVELTSINETTIMNLESLKLTLEALMDVKKLSLSPEFESSFQFILSLDNASLFDEDCREVIIDNYKQSIENLLKSVQKLRGEIIAEQQTRAKESISLIYEQITFESNLKFTFATFGAVQAAIAAMAGAVGVAGTYVGIVAETAVVTTAAAATGGIGVLLLGGSVITITCMIRNALHDRYKIRCKQNRCTMK